MNCREWEERIAGDAEDPAVREHLAECVGCQLFASGLREALELLQVEHERPIAAAHYSAVRARVLEELRPRRQWGWIWASAAASMALAAVSVGHRMRVAELPVLVSARVPAAPVVRARGQAMKNDRPAYERVRPKAERKGGEEVVMKIETPNPEVVIYWIAEVKSEE
jgi:hypothetical protein